MDLRTPSYRIFPLGDYALTIDFGNEIKESTNKSVLALFEELSKNPFPGMIEAVPAYSSLTVYYDVYAIHKNANGEPCFDIVQKTLDQVISDTREHAAEPAGTNVDIPICYDREYAPDLAQLAKQKNMDVGEFIQIHHSKTYRVYMLGFLPGFSYLGEVDERLAAPRKMQPAMVAAGSVGLAGRQTGIYPLQSPGGWQIIGRTPLKLFDVSKPQPSLLLAGDTVRFIPISKNEFESY